MVVCRRILTGAGLVVLAASCATTGSPQALEDLHVLVYNIHAGKDARNVDNLERVASIVRESGADVVLLQELDVRTRRSNGVDQPAVLAERTGLHVAFGKSLDYQGGDYGIAILARWPITYAGTRALPVDPPQARSGGVYEPRVALVVSVARPGGPLTIVNTHIDASADDRWRRQEIRTIVALADSLASSGATLLVGGDFNSTPESVVQRSMRETAMRDAWMECGKGEGFTYPAPAGVKRIDYLYLGRRLRCRAAEVLHTDASDHSPLLVTVRQP